MVATGLLSDQKASLSFSYCAFSTHMLALLTMKNVAQLMQNSLVSVIIIVIIIAGVLFT